MANGSVRFILVRHSLIIDRLIESTARSLNNLLEHFHQSFFFYLLPGPRRYVSIGMYYPPLVLVAIGLILKVCFAWILSVC
jgi:glycosylphosphatidylinositol transamidase